MIDRTFANLGNNHLTGVFEVIGITDMEYFTMTFRIADGSDVVRARCPIDAGLASAAGFAGWRCACIVVLGLLVRCDASYSI